MHSWFVMWPLYRVAAFAFFHNKSARTRASTFPGRRDTGINVGSDSFYPFRNKNFGLFDAWSMSLMESSYYLFCTQRIVDSTKSYSLYDFKMIY